MGHPMVVDSNDVCGVHLALYRNCNYTGTRVDDDGGGGADDVVDDRDLPGGRDHGLRFPNLRRPLPSHHYCYPRPMGFHLQQPPKVRDVLMDFLRASLMMVALPRKPIEEIPSRLLPPNILVRQS